MRSGRIRIRRATTVAALAVVLVAGCSDNHQTAAPYQLSDNVQFSYRWSSTPGLGLDSDAAIVTRATIESAFIATIMRTTNKSDEGKFTYPGYTRAVAPVMTNAPGSLYSVWDAGTLDSWVPVHGTAYAYLVSVQKSSGDATAHTMDALACVWFNGLSVSLQPESFRSLFVLVPQAVRLKLRAPQDETPKLTALGHGPSRYPTTDVFGQWSVESVAVNSSWIQAKGVPYEDPCLGLPNNPVPPEQLNTTELTYYPKHLPALDPVPGWAATNAEPTKP
ncbi:hypothetical protein [Nocardia sp. NPDC056000]|uniref:hypothetical protein n=1 Tax=Nocardia sp. NPDC056000 TaxID=3345674 RepID=UPI0035E3AF2F